MLPWSEVFGFILQFVVTVWLCAAITWVMTWLIFAPIFALICFLGKLEKKKERPDG